MKKTGISTRATERGSVADSDEGQTGRRLSETAEADERPLTAAVFKETIQQITDGMLRQQLELQAQQQRFLQQFAEQMAQRLVPSEPLVLSIEPQDVVEEERPPENGNTPDGVISVTRSRDSANGSQRQTGIKVSWLATQIPEFGGTTDESVCQWVRRVDKVAQVHGASDGVILLAASSRLTKNAKKWYDIQTGAVIESWSNLKSDLVKIFERKLLSSERCRRRNQGNGLRPRRHLTNMR